jgi:hypothetical protein
MDNRVETRGERDTVFSRNAVRAFPSAVAARRRSIGAAAMGHIRDGVALAPQRAAPEGEVFR